MENEKLTTPSIFTVPNLAHHLANAAGGIFSQEAMELYPTMETAQKDQLASYLFKKLFQDDSIKKAQDEAVKKQQELTKENIKNEIRFEKEKTKKICSQPEVYGYSSHMGLQNKLLKFTRY